MGLNDKVASFRGFLVIVEGMIEGLKGVGIERDAIAMERVR